MLHESQDAFVNQNYKARTLLAMPERNHAERLPRDGVPFDEIFRQFYPSFTEEEGELFGLIRGNSMWRVNQALRRSLREDPEFRSPTSHAGVFTEWQNACSNSSATRTTGRISTRRR